MVGLDRLLASAFMEVGSNGRVSERAQVVGWLLRKDPAARWSFEDMHVSELAQGIRLVRYQAKRILPEPRTPHLVPRNAHPAPRTP
jgi:hypothetical protein